MLDYQAYGLGLDDVDEIIHPNPGPQELFLSTDADIAIFGGGAGSGKTFALLLEPMHYIDVHGFGAVCFRRTYKQITNEGGLWHETQGLYRDMGGTPRESDLLWTFPAGTHVSFRHLQYDSTRFDYHGAQIALILFDELTTFTETQFWYMLSRNRSMCGVRPYIRATTNADADSWVAKLIDWWIGEDGFPIAERAGVKRWFIRRQGELIWADSPQELKAKYPDARPKSLTFIPATLDDNPKLREADPDYEGNLEALPQVDFERLRLNNWKIRPAAGTIFQKEWFPSVPAYLIPYGGIEVRYWDFAATEVSAANPTPDYTASCRMRLINGKFYIMDIEQFQEDPTKTDEIFFDTIEQDIRRARAEGIHYFSRWETEPGSSGKRDTARLIRDLRERFPGLDAAGRRKKTAKLLEAKPVAIEAKAGNYFLKKADWNDLFRTHMYYQPDYPHDDIMDCTSGAHKTLLIEEKVWMNRNRNQSRTARRFS